VLLFPVGRAARQRIVFLDEQTQEEIVGWVVKEHRYVYGLDEWYRENEIPGWRLYQPATWAGAGPYPA
jgi:hypothetical protein